MSNTDLPESDHDVQKLPKQLLDWVQQRKMLDRAELAELEKDVAQQISSPLEGIQVRVIDPRELEWPGDLADEWDADDY